jgi:hypothetical protein
VFAAPADRRALWWRLRSTSLGAWGTAIFSDDTASDVRDEWRDAILDGLSAEDATQRLLESFDEYLEDADTEKLFWMALAAAQMETGRLLAEVCDRALAIIDAGGDVDRWREDGDDSLARQRARVLERLAAKLRGPQPEPKRLRRPVALSVSLEVGDVVRVGAQREGENEVLVVVVGHGEGLAPGELYPIVAPLAWEGRRVPKRDRIARLPFLPDPVAPEKPLLILVGTFSKSDVFGPDLGEVVAQGVDMRLTAEADDVTHHMGWRVVAASAQEAWLMARYRAENDN